jgi:hypothetical protein
MSVVIYGTVARLLLRTRDHFQVAHSFPKPHSPPTVLPLKTYSMPSGVAVKPKLYRRENWVAVRLVQRLLVEL